MAGVAGLAGTAGAAGVAGLAGAADVAGLAGVAGVAGVAGFASVLPAAGFAGAFGFGRRPYCDANSRPLGSGLSQAVPHHPHPLKIEPGSRQRRALRRA